jgi:pimeloyl-ACP methyl ester carboxylesterase
MPKVQANGIQINYEEQGTGEPIVLIPYLAADNACYAFQVADYAKEYRCISLDPRGAGESDKPEGSYSMELFADDVAAFMEAIGVQRAHIMGLSLGAAVGMWMGVKYPDRVGSLSLHSGWTKTDPYLRTVVESWRALAEGLGDVQEMVILGILPWCLTPELYATKPDYVESLAAFVRSRPKQPLDAFMRQSAAVLDHDVESQVGRIKAPTLLTFGRWDLVCSTRFVPWCRPIVNSEVYVFEDAAHAPIYQDAAAFNERTLAFLRAHPLPH